MRNLFPHCFADVKRGGAFLSCPQKEKLKVKRTIIDHFLSPLGEKTSPPSYRISLRIIFSFNFKRLHDTNFGI